MKRRDAIKGLTFLPIAGGAIVSGTPSTVSNASETVTNKLLKEEVAAPMFSMGQALSSGSFKPGPEIFRSIGVEPIINCRGTFTIIGGSLERPSVRQAMEAASRSFVQYDELADGIGQRLAELTGAEWGMVSAGCAAGLKHVTAACVTGGNPEKLVRIPNLTGFEKNEVIIPRSSRNAYDHAIRNIGVNIITVDTMEDLANALNARTAMIYMGSKNLEATAKIANPKNIPILVDAAAHDLTIPNVYLQQGAAVVAYSGGKAMCGPQCAGLLLGRKDILMSAWQASSPHHGPGRDNKVGREEMIGMLAAVEAWIRHDHKKQWKTWLSYLDNISKQLMKIDGVKTEIYEPGIMNHSPVLNISWHPDKFHITGEALAEEVARSKPRIALGSDSIDDNNSGMTTINITSGQMQPGEDKIVAERIFEILSRKPVPKPSLKSPIANINGRWDVDIEFFSSSSRHTLALEQDGNWLQGTHKGDFTVRDINGSIDGSTITLRSNDIHTADYIPFIFSGNFSGETISGVIHMGEYRTAKFVARRHDRKNLYEPIIVPGGPPLAT